MHAVHIAYSVIITSIYRTLTLILSLTLTPTLSLSLTLTQEIVNKTLISAEPAMVSGCNHSRMPRGGAFELFGFDILIDNKLKPWLIEVNIMPSLSSSSPLDKQIKHALMSDVFHTIGDLNHYPCFDASRNLELTLT